MILFFNAFCIYSMTSGSPVTSWTSAVLLPILKPGKPKIYVSSYRPIVFTTVSSRLFKRITFSRLTRHLLDNKILHHRHLGFQPFRDSHSALTLLHLDLRQATKDKYILRVALDLQAAYHSVYIDGLIYRCV